MSALKSVSDYVADARILLQDTVSPYRYDSPSLLIAFNVILLEGRRIRPDLFVFCGDDVPQFSAVDSTKVDIEQQFRLAFVYGMVGHALSRDQEDVQDERANTYMETFVQMLTGVTPSRLRGGTPQQPTKAQ